MRINSLLFVRLGALGILLSAFSFPAYAQNLRITNQKVKIEDGQEVDAWAATLDQNIEAAQNTFSKFLKNTYNIKVNKRGKDILAAEKATLPEISSLRGDLRAVFRAEAGGCVIGMSFSPGYDIHITKEAYPADFTHLQAFVKKYVKFHYVTTYQEQIADTEKKIKQKKGDIEKEEKRMEKLQQTIGENDTKIAGGDAKADKLKEKNEKMVKDKESAQELITKLQAEVTELNELITKTNAYVKKVNEF